jgi:hypothetical protein
MKGSALGKRNKKIVDINQNIVINLNELSNLQKSFNEEIIKLEKKIDKSLIDDLKNISFKLMVMQLLKDN